MKKIIAAFDGLKLSESTNQYAIEIASQSNTYLVGVFLEDVSYHSYKMEDLADKKGLSDLKIKQLKEKDRNTRKKSVEIFKAFCKKSGIQYSLHRDKSYALQELLHMQIS